MVCLAVASTPGCILWLEKTDDGAKPWTSPAEFTVHFDPYMESVKNNYSIGMRFVGEEAPEQRFTGIIVGDADPKRGKDSKWRCLKVRWDETSMISLPDRVSPWKIEPALSPPALNPLPVSITKRPRSSILPSSPDSSVLTREVFADIFVSLFLFLDFSLIECVGFPMHFLLS